MLHRYFPAKSERTYFRFLDFETGFTLARTPSQMSLGLKSLPTDMFEGLKDVYGHNNKNFYG